jgi:hypothetical protein
MNIVIFRKLPNWYWLSLIVFYLTGMMIASIMKPWSGEDEPSHYGYIDNLAMTNNWYAFETNHSSIETRMAHRWWDISSNRDQVIAEFENGVYRYYGQFHSDHQNATAYQPPLYYWLLAKIKQLVQVRSPFDWLYIFRYINVFLGSIYITICYLIARVLFQNDRQHIVATVFVSWLPLLSLLTATVTVQIIVFILYGLFLLLLLRATTQPIRHYFFAGIISILGIITQQGLYLLPVLWVSFLVYDLWRGIVLLKPAIGMSLLLIVGILVTSPQLIERHEATAYTSTDQEFKVRRIDSWHYLPSQWQRLKITLIDNWWDQHNSMIPYHSDTKAVFLGKLLLIGGIVGSVGYTAKLLLMKRKEILQNRKLIILSITLISLIAGHMWFDFKQLIYSGQEYLKARYLFPVLPIIVFGIVFGWRKILSDDMHYRVFMLFSIGVLVWLQTSALAWLMFNLK